MIEFRAVVEVTGSHVALSGRMSQDEVGAVLAAIADYNSGEEDEPAPLHGLLEADGVIMAGGLVVRDAGSGVAIEPGCCTGLEDWREWRNLADGGALWNGHSPGVAVEFGDDAVRMWHHPAPVDGPVCVIPLVDLTAHLEGVRRDLLGFLERVREWAPDGLGDALAARFDEEFRISAPL
ncbi:hypothetical protein AB0E59_00565 [Lentzea sp. NPDC034063]|uniref:hypothetical protein n=1 Tax=unclassified Lentzea TaxID=2643253 RepID=UPI0033C7C592